MHTIKDVIEELKKLPDDFEVNFKIIISGPNRQKMRYTKEEDNIIKSGVKKDISDVEISKLLTGRTPQSVKVRRQALGLHKAQIWVNE